MDVQPSRLSLTGILEVAEAFNVVVKHDVFSRMFAFRAY
jgi:hypothetical protein